MIKKAARLCELMGFLSKTETKQKRAALITAPWREAKKGFLEKDQEMRKVAV
jgi:hypothetical protein